MGAAIAGVLAKPDFRGNRLDDFKPVDRDQRCRLAGCHRIDMYRNLCAFVRDGETRTTHLTGTGERS